MRDEALFRCGISREIPPSLLSLRKVLDTLDATLEVPGHTISFQVEHRGSRHNSRRVPVFPSHLEMKVHFPASSRKESRPSRHTSRGGGFNLKLVRNTRDHATITKDPDVLMHSRENRFHSTDSTVTWSINSKHNGRCESPVAL